jgi:hypothetical protein
MRIAYKYKKYSKSFFLPRVPVRVLKFKRPKWNRVQSFISNQQNIKLYNSNLVKVNVKNWEKIKNNFKDKLVIRSKISLLSKNAKINVSIYKSRRNKILFTVHRIFYSPCEILWYSNFTRSINNSRQQIEMKNVFLNGNSLKNNSMLKKGDVICIKNNLFHLSHVLDKYFLQILIFSHLEIDYYTQELIITKNLEDLDKEDLFLTTLEYIDSELL